MTLRFQDYNAISAMGLLFVSTLIVVINHTHQKELILRRHTSWISFQQCIKLLLIEIQLKNKTIIFSTQLNPSKINFFLQYFCIHFLVDYQISCPSVTTKVGRSTTLIYHSVVTPKVLTFIRSLFQWKVIQHITFLNNN